MRNAEPLTMPCPIGLTLIYDVSPLTSHQNPIHVSITTYVKSFLLLPYGSMTPTPTSIAYSIKVLTPLTGELTPYLFNH